MTDTSMNVVVKKHICPVCNSDIYFDEVPASGNIVAPIELAEAFPSYMQNTNHKMMRGFCESDKCCFFVDVPKNGSFDEIQERIEKEYKSVGKFFESITKLRQSIWEEETYL